MSTSNISERQLAANRANAQKSTGPTSEEGKKISSRNSCRHNLTGQVSTMTEEDRAAYNIHLDAFMDDLKPQGALEMTLVNSVAHGFWRLHRAEAMEENTFAMEAERNEHTIECVNPQITEALLQAKAFFNNPQTFALLTLYEQRIHRRTHKDLKTLMDRQANRPVKQVSQLPSAQAAAQPKVKSASSSQNGFVFSNALQPSADPAPSEKIDPQAPESTAEVPKVA